MAGCSNSKQLIQNTKMIKRISISAVAFIAIFFSNLGIKAQTPKINLLIKKEILIDAGVEKAWQVLGPQFTDAYKWASTVSTSEGQGEKIGDIYSERVCITPMGTLKEKVLEYSAGNHLLSYSFEGMPKMVRFAKNTWQLTSIDTNKTKLSLVMEIKIGGFMGKMMKPMMKGKMAKMVNHTTEEFKYYVETGQPHPRKIKAIHKSKKY